jgi:hypothetical protein
LQQLLALAPFKPPDSITTGKALLARSQEQLVLSGDDRPYQQWQQDRNTAGQHAFQVGLQRRHGFEVQTC